MSDFIYSPPQLSDLGIFSPPTTSRLYALEDVLSFRGEPKSISEVIARLSNRKHVSAVSKLTHPLAQRSFIRSGRGLSALAGDLEIYELTKGAVKDATCLLDAINSIRTELGVAFRLGPSSTKREGSGLSFHYPRSEEMLRSIMKFNNWECPSAVLRAFNLYAMLLVLHPLRKV